MADSLLQTSTTATQSKSTTPVKMTNTESFQSINSTSPSNMTPSSSVPRIPSNGSPMQHGGSGSTTPHLTKSNSAEYVPSWATKAPSRQSSMMRLHLQAT